MLRRLLTVLAMVVTASGAIALPGSAWGNDSFCPSELNDGSDMVNTFCYSWRSTYVLDVGQHAYVTRGDLMRYQHVYRAYGFLPNFVWYATETHQRFEPGRDSHVKWASCKNEYGTQSNPYPDHERPWQNRGEPTGLCTDRIVRAEDQAKTLLDSFDGNAVTLRVLRYKDWFIALECGNFSAAPQEQPVPVISGSKFHDRDRNGVRDAGDPGMGGWEMRLFRDSSLVGQPTGDTGLRATTGSDGRYEFRLWEQGPGTYHVEEVQQPGFVQTRAPGAVHVPFGAGSTAYPNHDFGNVEDTADVVKVDWQVVSPPERLDAGVPTTLNVRAVVTNTGPAPEVDVTDTVWVRGQADCVFAPEQQAVTRRLRRDEPVAIDFAVTVTCEDPSNHLFLFDNALRVTTPGVTDPDGSDNARSTSVTIPVFDDSDLRLTDAALDCPARTDVGLTFTCTGSAILHNDGPYGPTNADVAFAIAPPGDCTVAGGTARVAEDTGVPAMDGVPVAVSWAVTCAQRSYHPISMTAVAGIDHEHVEDHVPANDTASAADTIEVFEAVDLFVVSPMRLACGARLPSTTSFACDLRVTVGNAGPATAVATATRATLAAPGDCAVTPHAATLRTTLDAGERETLAFAFNVVCANPVLRTLLATATISADEPHAEDLHRANDTRRVRWVPTDVKPRSEPSSVNVAKEGVVPVSILSTPEFDAFSEVDRGSLRWGVTGFESSLVACGGAAEDTNGDGYADLVCRFDTKLAGITCTTREAILTGYLKDGTPFESQDPVNVTGCKK